MQIRQILVSCLSPVTLFFPSVFGSHDQWKYEGIVIYGHANVETKSCVADMLFVVVVIC